MRPNHVRIDFAFQRHRQSSTNARHVKVFVDSDRLESAQRFEQLDLLLGAPFHRRFALGLFLYSHRRDAHFFLSSIRGRRPGDRCMFRSSLYHPPPTQPVLFQSEFRSYDVILGANNFFLSAFGGTANGMESSQRESRTQKCNTTKNAIFIKTCCCCSCSMLTNRPTVVVRALCPYSQQKYNEPDSKLFFFL